jgi:hypothetical protein
MTVLLAVGLGCRPAEGPAREAPEARTATAAPGRVVELAVNAAGAHADAEAPAVMVPDDTRTLRLALKLPPRSVRSWLSGLLKTAAGAPIWSGDVVSAAEGAPAIVELPALKMPRGDYQLVLRRAGHRGFDTIARYPFRVLRD